MIEAFFLAGFGALSRRVPWRFSLSKSAQRSILVLDMEFVKNNFFWIALTIGLLLIIIRYKWRDFSKKKAQQKRFKRGLEMEEAAAKFLIKRGFKIEKAQAEFQHIFKVNGVENSAKLVVDYLVFKDDKSYLVEVKSGASAVSIKDKNTRRQILEYSTAIACNGIYLLDMENENLQLIEFNHQSNASAESKSFAFYIAIFICCMGAAAAPSWNGKAIFLLMALLFCLFPKFFKRLFGLF